MATPITDSIAAIQALASERDTLANALAAAEEQIADLRARAERADAELARAEERRKVPLDAEKLARIYTKHVCPEATRAMLPIEVAGMRAALLALREAMGSEQAVTASLHPSIEDGIKAGLLAAFDAACSVAAPVHDKSREANEIHRLEICAALAYACTDLPAPVVEREAVPEEYRSLADAVVDRLKKRRVAGASPADPRPVCIGCGVRWVPAEGVDATQVRCDRCERVSMVESRPLSKKSRRGSRQRPTRCGRGGSDGRDER